jgi:hypothetical protein
MVDVKKIEKGVVRFQDEWGKWIEMPIAEAIGAIAVGHPEWLQLIIPMGLVSLGGLATSREMERKYSKKRREVV